MMMDQKQKPLLLKSVFLSSPSSPSSPLLLLLLVSLLVLLLLGPNQIVDAAITPPSLTTPTLTCSSENIITYSTLSNYIANQPYPVLCVTSSFAIVSTITIARDVTIKGLSSSITFTCGTASTIPCFNIATGVKVTFISVDFTTTKAASVITASSTSEVIIYDSSFKSISSNDQNLQGGALHLTGSSFFWLFNVDFTGITLHANCPGAAIYAANSATVVGRGVTFSGAYSGTSQVALTGSSTMVLVYSSMSNTNSVPNVELSSTAKFYHFSTILSNSLVGVTGSNYFDKGNVPSTLCSNCGSVPEYMCPLLPCSAATTRAYSTSPVSTTLVTTTPVVSTTPVTTILEVSTTPVTTTLEVSTTPVTTTLISSNTVVDVVSTTPVVTSTVHSTTAASSSVSLPSTSVLASVSSTGSGGGGGAATPDSGSSSPAAAVGGAVGGVAVLVLLVLLFLYLRKKKGPSGGKEKLIENTSAATIPMTNVQIPEESNHYDKLHVRTNQNQNQTYSELTHKNKSNEIVYDTPASASAYGQGKLTYADINLPSSTSSPSSTTEHYSALKPSSTTYSNVATASPYQESN